MNERSGTCHRDVRKFEICSYLRFFRATASHRPAHLQTIHTVFPGHYCTCSSFQFDVVKSQDALQCKHQLAARLAALLHQCRVESVDERTIIEMLDDPFRT